LHLLVYDSNILIMKNLIKDCEGFEWDEGNSDKNWIRHQLGRFECEELFFNQPLIIKSDTKHSESGKRYYSLGRTDSNRFLFISFTLREKLIRVISARDMTQKERKNMKKQLKDIPKFKNEDEEREFWAHVDSSEYINWNNGEVVSFPKLKPSTKTISLRIPESMLEELRVLANKRDVPYQSLIKIYLKEKINSEFRRTA